MLGRWLNAMRLLRNVYGFNDKRSCTHREAEKAYNQMLNIQNTVDSKIESENGLS